MRGYFPFFAGVAILVVFYFTLYQLYKKSTFIHVDNPGFYL